MRAWSVFLHVVLCIALILNGSVPAMAHGGHGESKSSSATSGAVKPDVETTHHAAPKQHGCHDEAASVSHVDAASSDQAAAPGHAPCSKDGGGDCCKQGTCGGSCAQHCAASLLPPSTPRAASLPSADSARKIAIGHHAPPLPHLIRPPLA